DELRRLAQRDLQARDRLVPVVPEAKPPIPIPVGSQPLRGLGCTRGKKLLREQKNPEEKEEPERRENKAKCRNGCHAREIAFGEYDRALGKKRRYRRPEQRERCRGRHETDPLPQHNRVRPELEKWRPDR